MAAALLSCSRTDPPSDIRIELPGVVASRDPVAVSVRIASAGGGVVTEAPSSGFSVEPSELATVAASGFVTCQRSGDGKLTLSIAGVSGATPLRCRLVDRLEAASLGRVELNGGPIKPPLRVLDKAGVELSDVDVSIVSENSAVISAKDGMLVPKLVGHASLVARAGQASSPFTVDVVRKVVVEALPIDDNHRIFFSLEPAKYELKVRLTAAKHMKAEWRGAPYCDGGADGVELVSTCELRGKGGVVFDNPGYLNSGSKKLELDAVELHEVP
ncbi:MAG TPA: hypothetical protein VGI10_06080 [Polyangiaceae bacterium]